MGFLLLEVFRKKLKPVIPFLIDPIEKYLFQQIDERDNPNFILTHTFLLYGCFNSLLYSYSYGFKDKLGKMIGLIVISIGDSFASIIGSKFGKHKIYNNKSFEGFLSGLISTFITIYFITPENIFYIPNIICISIIFVYELITKEIDNLVLPILSWHIYYLKSLII
jgi:dolichol kinase